MSTFDRRVVVSGAIAGLFFALPAAVLHARSSRARRWPG